MNTNEWRVLVAEDDPVLAYCVNLSLQLNGCAVQGPFARVADAHESVAASRPDAAVLDFRLRDGTCERLVKDLADLDVPVILVTGHELDELPDTVHSARILLKPVHADVLLEEIAQLCRNMPSADARAAHAAEVDRAAQFRGPLIR